MAKDCWAEGGGKQGEKSYKKKNEREKSNPDFMEIYSNQSEYARIAITIRTKSKFPEMLSNLDKSFLNDGSILSDPNIFIGDTGATTYTIPL